MAAEVLAVLAGITAIICIFVILPGLVLHHISKWRSSGGLSEEEERMLEDLWHAARQMERRLETLERLMAAEEAAPRKREGDRPGEMN